MHEVFSYVVTEQILLFSSTMRDNNTSAKSSERINNKQWSNMLAEASEVWASMS